LFALGLVPLNAWELSFFFLFAAGNAATVGGSFLLGGDGGLLFMPSASFCLARHVGAFWMCLTKPP
jgi:hypothetical protein